MDNEVKCNEDNVMSIERRALEEMAQLDALTQRGTIRVGMEEAARGAVYSVLYPLIPRGGQNWLVTPRKQEKATHYIVRAERARTDEMVRQMREAEEADRVRHRLVAATKAIHAGVWIYWSHGHWSDGDPIMATLKDAAGRPVAQCSWQPGGDVEIDSYVSGIGLSSDDIPWPDESDFKRNWPRHES